MKQVLFTILCTVVFKGVLLAQYVPHVEHLSKIFLMNETGHFLPKTNYELLSYVYNDWQLQDSIPLDSCHYYFVDSSFLFTHWVHKQTEYTEYDNWDRMTRRYLIDLETNILLRDEYVTWTTDSVSQLKINGTDSAKVVYQLENGRLEEEHYYHFSPSLVLDSVLYYGYDFNNHVSSELCLGANGDTLLYIVYVPMGNKQFPASYILAPTAYTIETSTDTIAFGVGGWEHRFKVNNGEWNSRLTPSYNPTDLSIIGNAVTRYYLDSLGEVEHRYMLFFRYTNSLFEMGGFNHLHDTIVDNRLFQIFYFWRNPPTATKQPNTIAANALEVYPNPTTGRLHFRGFDGEEAAADRVVVLYNQLGQLVHRERLDAGVGIDIGHLQAGLYFYGVEESRRMLYSGRVVKE